MGDKRVVLILGMVVVVIVKFFRMRRGFQTRPGASFVWILSPAGRGDRLQRRERGGRSGPMMDHQTEHAENDNKRYRAPARDPEGHWVARKGGKGREGREEEVEEKQGSALFGFTSSKLKTASPRFFFWCMLFC